MTDNPLNAVRFVYDSEDTGDAWSLLPESTVILDSVLDEIRMMEFQHNVQRIVSPVVRACPSSEKQNMTGEESIRFVGHLWTDRLDIAAGHLLQSYRQLPLILSTVADLYQPRHHLQWCVAAYGASVPTELQLLGMRLAKASTFYTVFSKHKIRNKENELYQPSVAIMHATLLDGKP